MPIVSIPLIVQFPTTVTEVRLPLSTSLSFVLGESIEDTSSALGRVRVVAQSPQRQIRGMAPAPLYVYDFASPGVVIYETGRELVIRSVLSSFPSKLERSIKAESGGPIDNVRFYWAPNAALNNQAVGLNKDSFIFRRSDGSWIYHGLIEMLELGLNRFRNGPVLGSGELWAPSIRGRWNFYAASIVGQLRGMIPHSEIPGEIESEIARILELTPQERSHFRSFGQLIFREIAQDGTLFQYPPNTISIVDGLATQLLRASECYTNLVKRLLTGVCLGVPLASSAIFHSNGCFFETALGCSFDVEPGRMYYGSCGLNTYAHEIAHLIPSLIPAADWAQFMALTDLDDPNEYPIREGELIFYGWSRESVRDAYSRTPTHWFVIMAERYIANSREALMNFLARGSSRMIARLKFVLEYFMIRPESIKAFENNLLVNAWQVTRDANDRIISVGEFLL